MLIGGWAVGLYGHVRATGDIDFWISDNDENARKMVNLLRAFGFQDEAVNTELIQSEGHIRFGVPPMRVEILMSVSGIEFDACYARRVQKKLGDLSVWVISLPDLVANKRASGRLKDLADLEELGEL